MLNKLASKILPAKICQLYIIIVHCKSAYYTFALPLNFISESGRIT